MIIFDCDGVLVDSEILSNSIDAELMTGVGHAISASELIENFIGRPKAEIWADIAGRRGVPWPDGLLAKAESILVERFATDLQPVDGAIEAVAALPGPLAVASSSALPKLRLALAVTGLLQRFDPRVFSASQVARGKPEPDVFLHAADRCGVRPGDCIVVEDSVAGVTAARRAGMRVLGFTGGRHSYRGHADKLAAGGALEVVAHMRDLPARLGALGRPPSGGPPSPAVSTGSSRSPAR